MMSHWLFVDSQTIESQESLTLAGYGKSGMKLQWLRPNHGSLNRKQMFRETRSSHCWLTTCDLQVKKKDLQRSCFFVLLLRPKWFLPVKHTHKHSFDGFEDVCNSNTVERKSLHALTSVLILFWFCSFLCLRLFDSFRSQLAFSTRTSIFDS
jgi:hypothetical protein